MKNYIVKPSTGTVYLRQGITKKEEDEVRKLYSHWVIKPCKPAKKKPEAHTITEDFNIPYDEVQKEDMYKYIKQFKTEQDLKDFAIASHKSKKGEIKKVKKMIIRNGKKKEEEVLQYFHIAAKDYFFATFFPKRWEEILAMKEERKAKFSKGKSEEAKQKEAMELELLDLLNI